MAEAHAPAPPAPEAGRPDPRGKLAAAAAAAAADVENPPDSLPLPSNGPPAHFNNPKHAATARFLYYASASGKLGLGPAEPDLSRSSGLRIIAQTIPWRLLALQLLWSGAVLGIAYALRETNPDGSNVHKYLSVEFWTSKLNVSSSISYGVGWALFVLLGFFVREANGRYKEAQFAIENSMNNARQLFRQMRQLYRPGFWHPGDADRLAAHFVAFPIALKMTLRGERERAPLERILHPDDVSDVLATDMMYTQCTRVIRGYLSAGEDDSPFAFQHAAADKTLDAFGHRLVLPYIIDGMDRAASAAVRIAHFHPSAGYLNHMRNFLYIWLFFLPLVLVKTSGFFTPLWTLIITYCVGMLFTIAQALNHPFGFDLQDIKLNRICAGWAYEMLLEHALCRFDLKDILRADHETPQWLEKPCEVTSGEKGSKKWSVVRKRMAMTYKGLGRNLATAFVMKYLIAFIVWLCFIAFLTWGVTRDTERLPADRWWTLYLPLSSSTSGFISLGVFLLLGFWMNDAYGRYWNCLQLWNTSIRPGLEGVAFLFGLVMKKGVFHQRDRERVFSFMVAYLYAVKLDLRQSRDVSELEGILDARDLQALSQAPNLPSHCLNIIFGYVNASEILDPEITGDLEYEWGWSVYNITFKMPAIQDAVTVCNATRKYPMSVSFTIHLFVYVMFWLAILPITLVRENGFLTFLFIIPVAYAIINLLSIGCNLSDPFGFDDEDIPMDKICDEYKTEIHRMYHELEQGMEGYVREEDYDRSSFVPGFFKTKKDVVSDEDDISAEKAKLVAKDKPKPDEEAFTLRKLVQSVLDHLPSVSIVAQVTATLWSVIAVLVSWRLSKISDEWENGTRGDCQEWCSPIDVDGDTLANIGYALFMLLSFRASDALGRYEDGAELIYDLKLQLHSSVVDTIYTYRQDWFHPKDRERFMAHVVQIPLLIRDRLLDGPAFNPVSRDTLLCEKDQRRLAESKNPFEYLLRTAEAYVVLLDKPKHEPFTSETIEIVQVTAYTVLDRFNSTRDIFAKMLSVKTYPVISRYSNHQYVFTALWLGLLPFYMTQQTGFFTILWAPLISYGVFALQSIAEKLVDPFGEDAIDIPVRKLLTETAEELIYAVHTYDWDSYKMARGPPPQDSSTFFGAHITDEGVDAKRQFAYFEDHEATVENFGQTPMVEFKSAEEAKPKPNLLMHLVHSVPWWGLLGIVSWTALGCVISYISRDKSVTDERWWKSGISVATNIATYVSFAAFTLLGFYVQAAFKRYDQAGSVWGDSLRASCHDFATQLFTFAEDGVVHEKDRDRILGHVAALPLILKLELRKSRDLRELMGLLSPQDIGRIQAARSMTVHCVDVLRAFICEVAQHPDRLVKDNGPLGGRLSFLNSELNALQRALRAARFLNEFEVAPGFIDLLHSLLAIWFLFLPFVLAEISGWFTILWVAIIGYGVLGMYSVAAELQSPFGLDVNDLDLDKIADFVVRDVLFVQKNYKSGLGTLTRPSEPVELWNPESAVATRSASFFLEKEEPFAKRLKDGIILSAKSVPPLQIVFAVVWSALSVLLAYGVSKWFKIESCDSTWFCSYIAINGSLPSFIGFALFLLLGFRLYDSHGRYVTALRLWQDEILAGTRTLTTRFIGGYSSNTFHKGDLERICGHIAAFAICAMGSLRGEDYADKLAQVVSEADVERILSARERIDYCMDVVRSYALTSDDCIRLKTKDMPIGVFDNFVLKDVIRTVSQSAYECRRLVRIPLPFGYVMHLKIFLLIWLLLLPLSLVEETGWLTTLWVVFIAYGVLGVEHWSEELADPFGHDISDVPLDEMCDRVIAETKTTFDLVKDKGIGVWVRPERDGLVGKAPSEIASE